MDDLLEWIEILHVKVKGHKECLEQYAHVLKETSKPWPLESAPQKYQDSYKRDVERLQEKKTQSNVSEIDQDLQNVEALLKKARLLHEKETATIASKKSSVTKTTDESVKDLSKKTAKPKSAQGKLISGKVVTANKATKKRPVSAGRKPLQTAPTKSSSAKFGPGGIPRKPLRANSRQQNAPSLPKTAAVPTITRKNTSRAENGTQDSEDDKKQPSEKSRSPKNAEKQEKVVIDFSKVKLNLEEFINDLEIPTKLGKLQTTHSKLRGQIGGYINGECCPEEDNFIRAFSDTDKGETQTSYRTLSSVNRELEEYLIICSRAVAVLQNRDALQPSSRSSRIRWSAQEDLYHQGEVLKLVQETAQTLSRKLRVLSNVEIVDPEKPTSCGDLEISFTGDLVSQLSPHLTDLDGFADNKPYPSTFLSYQSINEVSQWACERLRHQSLIIERNLIEKLSKVYVPMINHLMKTKTDNSSDQNLVKILQNAFGVLAQKDILLPAFVVAEE